MSIRIIPINEKDGQDLLKFEVDNRRFFEESCISRGDEYYEEDNFKEILKQLIKEQEEGVHYMYLIKDNNDEIVGRINLVDIIKGYMNKAELGYRISKKHTGRGYGKKAVELILGEAYNIHKLHRIEAGTSIENLASQKILEGSGFRKVGIYNKYIYVNGKWDDSVIYEIILS